MTKINKRLALSLSKGFTLIELLIVIAVLSILAIAVLSAINPLEQMEKARDARRKSDSAELLNAYERYYTSFGCYPWDDDAPCTGPGSAMDATNPSFAVGGDSEALVTTEELKSQFPDRDTIVDNELFVTEAPTGQVSICFSPESESGRGGGLGPIMDQNNSGTGSCGATYAASDATCNVCVPQ